MSQATTNVDIAPIAPEAPKKAAVASTSAAKKVAKSATGDGGPPGESIDYRKILAAIAIAAGLYLILEGMRARARAAREREADRGPLWGPG